MWNVSGLYQGQPNKAPLRVGILGQISRQQFWEGISDSKTWRTEVYRFVDTLNIELMDFSVPETKKMQARRSPTRNQVQVLSISLPFIRYVLYTVCSVPRVFICLYQQALQSPVVLKVGFLVSFSDRCIPACLTIAYWLPAGSLRAKQFIQPEACITGREVIRAKPVTLKHNRN